MQVHTYMHTCMHNFAHRPCVCERGTESIGKEKEKVKNRKCYIYVTITFCAGAYISHSGTMRYSQKIIVSQFEELLWTLWAMWWYKQVRHSSKCPGQKEVPALYGRSRGPRGGHRQKEHSKNTGYTAKERNAEGKGRRKQIFRKFKTSDGGNFELLLIKSPGKNLLECRHGRHKDRNIFTNVTALNWLQVPFKGSF